MQCLSPSRWPTPTICGSRRFVERERFRVRVWKLRPRRLRRDFGEVREGALETPLELEDTYKHNNHTHNNGNNTPTAYFWPIRYAW